MNLVAKSRIREIKTSKRNHCNCKHVENCERTEKLQSRCNARECSGYKKPKK